MKRAPRLAVLALALVASFVGSILSAAEGTIPPSAIVNLDPPDDGFFSKRLDYQGIPIKAHKDVADEALFAARERLVTLLSKIPVVCSNLVTSGAELHIVGSNQVTSD